MKCLLRGGRGLRTKGQTFLGGVMWMVWKKATQSLRLAVARYAAHAAKMALRMGFIEVMSINGDEQSIHTAYT